MTNRALRIGVVRRREYSIQYVVIKMTKKEMIYLLIVTKCRAVIDFRDVLGVFLCKMTVKPLLLWVKFVVVSENI